MGGQPAGDEQDGEWEDELMSSGDEDMAADQTIEMVYESVGLGRRQAAGEEADVEMADSSEASEEATEECCVKRRCGGMQDIVFSGETDLAHGVAWNHYRFLGRARTWDGLIAIRSRGMFRVLEPKIRGLTRTSYTDSSGEESCANGLGDERNLESKTLDLSYYTQF
ncbi:hypothetical protein CONPUDRAFT_148005 [Coniophora puteana RWD-64-598 SS2]|uniref:Uncharacterized protein n=1 Tax=Coniophora puteana (strain RWD-64-598) TaxID=741705 RepID=R7SCA1_CONPW|nr:uncharacterized protein CONPUDRAFT_148005 [Coniophora puteana RWD-64-598 SS2]EIW73778.1 hypothetical protein CONPUDRAFT_148005 [Coniophora puteana RWD-64-598 SS2]